jgi:hypothetical protein
MGQLGEEPRFILKHTQSVLVLAVVREEPLNDDVSEETALAPLSSQVHLGHTARSYFVQEFVAPDLPVLHTLSIRQPNAVNKASQVLVAELFTPVRAQKLLRAAG